MITFDWPHTTGAKPAANATLATNAMNTARLHWRAHNHTATTARLRTPNTSCSTVCTIWPIVYWL